MFAHTLRREFPQQGLDMTAQKRIDVFSVIGRATSLSRTPCTYICNVRRCRNLGRLFSYATVHSPAWTPSKTVKTTFSVLATYSPARWRFRTWQGFILPRLSPYANASRCFRSSAANLKFIHTDGCAGIPTWKYLYADWKTISTPYTKGLLFIIIIYSYRSSEKQTWKHLY